MICSSGPFLDMIVTAIPFKNLAKTRERDVAVGKMNSHEPGTDEVCDMVELVGKSDAVDSCVYSEDEEEDIGDVAESKSSISASEFYLTAKTHEGYQDGGSSMEVDEPRSNSRNHLPARQCLDEQDEGHYR